MFGNYFLYTTKYDPWNKNDKLDLIKIKNFWSVNEKTSHSLGKIFAKQTSKKELISKIDKELLNPTVKKPKIKKKNKQRLTWHLTKEDI